MAAKHILACVDFSERSTRALSEVGRYAREHGSEVTLIHVTDPRAFIPPQEVLEPESPRDADAHRKALDSLRDEHLKDVDASIAVVEDHAPARAICEYADDHAVDLIVVGSQGHGAMERWLIGSVAERVVRHATVNVYVVRR